jgi:hypothetical protein
MAAQALVSFVACPLFVQLTEIFPLLEYETSGLVYNNEIISDLLYSQCRCQPASVTTFYRSF